VVVLLLTSLSGVVVVVEMCGVLEVVGGGVMVFCEYLRILVHMFK